MEKIIKGSCFCKKIQFKVEIPILTCTHCHCESCRRTHNAPFVTWTSFNISQLSFDHGENFLKKFESSKGNFRSFCSHCGTPLFAEMIGDDSIIYLPTSCFISEIDLKPTRHVSFEEKVSWLEVNDQLPKYKGKTELIS